MTEPDPPVGRLSSKYTNAQAGAGAGLGGAVGLAALVLLLAWQGEAVRDLGATVSMVLMGAVAFVPLLAGAVVSVTRSAAWLEGTTLVVRWMRTRRCELSTAEVAADIVRDDLLHGPPIPRLVVRGPGGGARLRLELRTNDLRLLPAAELRALAAALTAQGRPEGSPAARLADHLRRLADRPGDEL